MKTIEESVEVDVPVTTAYNQWTQFESFPYFMEGIERIEQVDDTHLHWVAKIGGEQHAWDAEITEQHPDERVAWRTSEADAPSGVVTFHKLDASHSKVMVQIAYEPEGTKHSIGSALGLDARRVKGDLKAFKDFIESRGQETGAWRREIENR